MACLDDILPSLREDNIDVWVMKRDGGGDTQVHTLLDQMDCVLDQPVPASLRAATSLKSPIMYIFTSGTTGECVVGALPFTEPCIP